MAEDGADGRYDDGEDPNEEAGPEGCAPGPDRCEFGPGDREGPPHEAEFTSQDELHEQFPLEDIPVVLRPDDGMACPVDPDHDLPFAHPFTIDSVVCLKDDRKYVELFREELSALGWCYHSVVSSYAPPLVAAMSLPPEGWPEQWRDIVTRPQCNKGGVDQERREFASAVVIRRWGVLFAKDDRNLIPVRPIRPRCNHYVRQVFAQDGTSPGEVGHKIVFRNCMARRSIGGAFMSLRDEAVYACDLRDPPDQASVEKELDAPDRKKIKERPDLTHTPMFGMPGGDVQYNEQGEEVDGK